MTDQELISELEKALYTGAKSITIADRRIEYRDLEEIAALIKNLKLKNAPSPLFSVANVLYSRGL